MTFDAKAIANAFLDIAGNAGETLTPMKLQKLIYFAHGWHLALTHEPLIAEPVEAWEFGPVVPSVYHEFKAARKGAIRTRAAELSLDDLEFKPVPPPRDDATCRLLQRVWNTYGKLSATQLSNLTHLPDTPWDQVQRPGARNVPIPDEIIEKHFEATLERNRAKRESGASR